MKTFLASFIVFIVISIIILTGCGNRDSLLDNAKINQSDIPVVLTADPSPDCSGVPANPVVSVRFSTPMDTGSVESAFTLMVESEVYTAGGVFEWLDGNRMFIYHPVSGSLTSGSLITATIDVTAESIYGIHLATEYKWSFTPGYNFYSGNPGILSILPTALQAILPTDLKIAIEFDRLMLHTTVESSFLLQCDSADEGSRTSDNGSFTWENTASGEKVIYIPNEILGNNNTYTLYLNNRGIMCRDLSGNALSDFVLTFYTADNAIYVSNDGGDDANDGRNSAIPVQSLDTAISRAVNYFITLIKIEGEGTGPDYTGSFSVPDGITIEGGWNLSFDQKGYTTYIEAGTSNQYTFLFSGVSGCTIDGLKIRGGEIPAVENAVILIQNSSYITIRNCNITASNLGTDTEGYGIKIDSSSNIIIDSNSYISGGNASSRNAGVYVSGTSQNVTIKNNDLIEGGWNGKTYGILLESGAGPITINGNTQISGGTTSNSDTYGIFIANGASVQIHRNTIEGGEESTSNTHTNYGIRLDSANVCSIFNNFISGSSNSTDSSNISCSIHAKDTNINVINNTIDGGGTGGINSSNGIYIEDSSGWLIDPIIVNNIIIGGKNSSKFGIYFLNNSQAPTLTCTINNNTFRGEGTYIDGSNNFTSVAFPNPITTSDVTEATDNLFYNVSPPVKVVFVNDTLYDYHISGTSPDTSSIKDNGYDVSTLSLDQSLLNELLIDIDGTTRNPATIDRGAHEFNP